MNILLVCASGMSTTLLVTDMKKYVSKHTMIKAVAFSELEDFVDDYDVVLVGPQLRYKMDAIKKITDDHNKPVDIIDSLAYGRIDGERVLQCAKDIFIR